MPSILVVYGTGEGQTAKVAQRLGETLRERGYETTVVDAEGLPSDYPVVDSDAVLVGSSIHVGSHEPAVRAFAREHHDSLSTRPTGFFQVSGASANDDGAAEATTYVEKLVEATNWRSDRIGLFGGAIRFSEYGFLLGALMKRVVESGFPDVDASGDVEFTDWESVDAFADAFATFVEERTGDAGGTE